MRPGARAEHKSHEVQYRVAEHRHKIWRRACECLEHTQQLQPCGTPTIRVSLAQVVPNMHWEIAASTVARDLPPGLRTGIRPRSGREDPVKERAVDMNPKSLCEYVG